MMNGETINMGNQKNGETINISILKLWIRLSSINMGRDCENSNDTSNISHVDMMEM
jgi:hypothetical protein